MYAFSIAVDFNGVVVLQSVLMPLSRSLQYILNLSQNKYSGDPLD